ncbi:MAG: DNA-protecting protein DprA [Clostridia bacterium]|nr:DNA-protecting protein DprA [Clostridia bacterium]
MNYTEDDLAVIALNSIPLLTERRRWELLSALESPRFLFDPKKLRPLLIETEKSDVYNSISDALCKEYAVEVVTSYEKKGYFAIPYTSENYPASLKRSEYFPPVLYAMGRMELLKSKFFCIVGSRRTLPNILKVTESLSKELSAHFTVLTGVAEGGDYAAAQGALEKGNVACMLAGGFDTVSLKQLHREVAKRGLLLSPFPPNLPTQKFLYRVRNRTMASLSEGILVVSAGKVSGALITGEYGLEMGKFTYAFPYTIGSASGEGCNALLKKGAYPTENILDILPDFGINLSKERSAVPLTREEQLVLARLAEREELHRSEIARETNLEEAELSAVLSALEIKNLIVRTGGNKYRPV